MPLVIWPSEITIELWISIPHTPWSDLLAMHANMLTSQKLSRVVSSHSREVATSASICATNYWIKNRPVATCSQRNALKVRNYFLAYTPALMSSKEVGQCTRFYSLAIRSGTLAADAACTVSVSKRFMTHAYSAHSDACTDLSVDTRVLLLL
jgi:hypothetical protein